MPLYKKAAKLEKPTALKNYLLGKNYVILATEVPVGDIVEYGLDWVVDVFVLFNNALGDTFLYFEDRLNLQDDKVRIMGSSLSTLTAYIHNLDIVTHDELSDWTDSLVRIEHEFIFSVTHPIAKDLADHIEHYKVLKELTLGLEEKIRTSNWDISTSLTHLYEDVGSITDEFGGHKNLFQLTWDFFADPVLWLYEVVDSLIERFF